MSRFDDFDRTVLEFMRDFGFIATYVKIVSSEPDDTTGTISSVTQEIPIEAIKMELNRPVNGMSSKLGTQIQEGDQVLYIRPTEKTDVFNDPLFIDVTSDRVLINGTPWKVVTMKEFNPSAADCVLYEMYIRR